MDTLLTKILEEPSIGLFALIAMLWLCFWVAYSIGRWTERFSRRSKKIISPGKNTWDEFFLSDPEVSEDFMCNRLRHQGGRHLNGGR
jgi:hypothetical protein